MFRAVLYSVAIVIGGWIGVAYVQSQMVELPTPQPQIFVEEIIEIPRITYYQAVFWQTDKNPEVSACGPTKKMQVAVSRDLFQKNVGCGEKIQVWSDEHGKIGEYTVWDTTNARFSSTVDILVEDPPHWGKTSGYIIID